MIDPERVGERPTRARLTTVDGAPEPRVGEPYDFFIEASSPADVKVYDPDLWYVCWRKIIVEAKKTYRERALASNEARYIYLADFTFACRLKLPRFSHTNLDLGWSITCVARR